MKRIVLLLLLIIMIGMPATAKKEIPKKTQLEVRQMQTREYETKDKAMVMKAMLNVLQDDGFIIYNANPLLGYIYSEKEFDNSSSSTDIAKEFGLSSSNLRWGGVTAIVVDSNANVTDFGNFVRVRMSFKIKLHNVYGSVISVTNVDSPEYYKLFFEKVNKAIFIQKQKI